MLALPSLAAPALFSAALRILDAETGTVRRSADFKLSVTAHGLTTNSTGASVDDDDSTYARQSVAHTDGEHAMVR